MSFNFFDSNLFTRPADNPAELSNPVGRLAASVAALVILGFSSPNSVSGQSAGYVDIGAFQGIWHEVARSPNLFQRNCRATTAEYRLKADGTLAVINRCTTASGRCKSIQGSARSANRCNNALIVSFPVPFGRFAERTGKPNYLIHYVSPDYQTAVVGSPKGRLVWLLSRSPHLPAAEFHHLKRIAANAGYRTANLIISR